MKLPIIILSFALFSNVAHSADEISIRTENYPRPPYSGATYYFYQIGNEVVCTKLEVCNKFGECSTEYRKGLYKVGEDVKAFDSSAPVVISREKYRKHRCLIKFGIVK